MALLVAAEKVIAGVGTIDTRKFFLKKDLGLITLKIKSDNSDLILELLSFIIVRSLYLCELA